MESKAQKAAGLARIEELKRKLRESLRLSSEVSGPFTEQNVEWFLKDIEYAIKEYNIEINKKEILEFIYVELARYGFNVEAASFAKKHGL